MGKINTSPKQTVQSYAFFKALTVLPFVEEIWMFGSRARGDNRPRSDIDLAILCPRASIQEWLTVCNIIDEADTLLKVDYVRFDTLLDSNSLKSAILQHAITLFKRKLCT